MASRCRSTLAVNARVPVRATFANIYGPQTDAEFVRSVAGGRHRVPVVDDTYSCRQMYLRSYTFSRKESLLKRTRKRLERVKVRGGGGEKVEEDEVVVLGGERRRIKKGSCSSLFAIFRKLLLSCAFSPAGSDEADLKSTKV